MSQMSMNKIALIFQKTQDAIPMEKLISSKFKDSEFFIFDSGIENIDLISKESPTLVLIDISIFNLTGFELARLIKMDNKTKDMPIIFLIPESISPSLKEYFLEFDNVEFLQKPINGFELLEKISHYLSSSESTLSHDTKIYSALFDATFNQHNDMVLMLQENEILEANQRCKAFFKSDIPLGKSIFDFLEDLKNNTKHNSIPKLIRATNNEDLIKANVVIDGNDFVLKIETKPYPLIESGVTITISDITESEKSIEEIRRKQEAEDALLLQQSKMASMGEMMGVILHQWKQPLNAISILTQFLEDYADEDGKIDIKDAIKTKDNILEQVAYMTEAATIFKNFFSPSKQKNKFLACEAVSEVFNILSAQLKMENIAYEIAEHEHFRAYGYKNELMHAAMNIINNAKDAIIEKGIKNGKIEVTMENDGERGFIKIADNAGGIPQDLLPDRLFEKYYSTKGGKGTGLGLHLSKSIIEESFEGKLGVRNNNDGAEFTITLPIANF